MVQDVKIRNFGLNLKGVEEAEVERILGFGLQPK